METAPTGTEMPWRKRNPSLNFLSVHSKKREIPFPQSLLSFSQSGRSGPGNRRLIQSKVCDGAVCFLVSEPLPTQGKVKQILRTVSFQGHCLPYLFFTVHWSTGTLVGSLQLVCPKASPSAFTGCNSPPRSQNL